MCGPRGVVVAAAAGAIEFSRFSDNSAEKTDRRIRPLPCPAPNLAPPCPARFVMFSLSRHLSAGGFSRQSSSVSHHNTHDQRLTRQPSLASMANGEGDAIPGGGAAGEEAGGHFMEPLTDTNFLLVCVCMCICVPVYVCMCVYACVYACASVELCVCSVHVCVCMCV